MSDKKSELGELLAKLEPASAERVTTLKLLLEHFKEVKPQQSPDAKWAGWYYPQKGEMLEVICKAPEACRTTVNEIGMKAAVGDRFMCNGMMTNIHNTAGIWVGLGVELIDPVGSMSFFFPLELLKPVVEKKVEAARLVRTEE